MGALTHNGEIMQGLPANASQINFDKTGTDLNATQTEAAIKEVNGKVNTNAEDITQLKSGLTGLSSNVVFEPQTAPSTSNPFGDDGTGYILKVKYNGVTLGYLVIRPKNYVDTSTSRKVALELFDNSWSKIWDIVRDNA